MKEQMFAVYKLGSDVPCGILSKSTLEPIPKIER